MQKIIIIGQPNVGKSSLFNRLLKRRVAITSEMSGTTRDLNKQEIQIYDKSALLIDSGGIDESSDIFVEAKKQTYKEIEKADIVLFVVDGKMYPTQKDRELFHNLLRLDITTALVINKIDSKKDEQRSWEFDSFGATNGFSISVSHNIGIDELLDFIYANLKGSQRAEKEELFEDFLDNFDDDGNPIDEKKEIKVGIVGRVNVGKSSLLNALVKKERSVVSKTPGTTIDPVNEIYTHNDRVFEFVDTAGIRRRSKIEGIEKFALIRTQKLLENSDVALLVLDASEPLTELDERIAGVAAKFEPALIIVLNKWDKRVAEFDEFSKIIKDKFKFLSYAPIISVSALDGKRVSRIYELIEKVYQNYTSKIQTSKLNEAVEEMTKLHPLPHDRGKLVKIYYAVQFGFAPPKIALIMNRPKALHFSYKRYIINQLRERFNLEGTPIVLLARSKNKDENDEEKK